MQKISAFLDIRTIIYILTTLFFIFAGWFGLKERVNILAADIEHNRAFLAKQEHYLESLKKDVSVMRDMLIRVQVLLEEKVSVNN